MCGSIRKVHKKKTNIPIELKGKLYVLSVSSSCVAQFKSLPARLMTLKVLDNKYYKEAWLIS